MKKLRFLIAIVLIFSLLPISFVSAADAADEVKAIETNEFKKLEAFGLISENDPIFYYDSVKRNAFISYVMKCYPGYVAGADVPGIENPFSDVNDKTEYANAISAAAHTGIISGIKGSNFRPNDYITKSEAAKVFVSMLGYSDYAERKGGYPSGYLAMAQSLGLFDGCEFDKDGYFTIKGFLRAFGNVLDTEVLEIRAINVDSSGKILSMDYRNVEEGTLLYNTFGIFEAKGIVEVNEYTSINGASALKSGEVLINGYVYKADNTDATSLLGYNTHYYYKKPKGAVRSEIVYIEPYKNNVVETHTNCIVKEAVTESNFRYYLNDTSDKYYDLDIAKSATLIHNGDLKEVSKANLCPANGTVTLIDYNEDKVFDVIFVMNYRTIMISSASMVTYTILDSFGGASIVLDPEDEEYDVMLEIEQPAAVKDKRYNTSLGLYGGYMPPVESKFSELKAGDIVLYAASENNNKNIKYAKVSRATVEGTVTAIHKNYFEINGEKYELSPDAKYTVSSGEYGVFYLDVFGKVVSKSLEKDLVMGYLNGINKDSTGFGSVVQLQIFSENGHWLILELADNVKTNITGDPAVFASLKPLAVYNALNAMPNFRQLINYTLNKTGKVNNITIAQRVEAYSDAEQDAIEQDIFRKVYLDDWGNNTDDCKFSTGGIYGEFGLAIGNEEVLIDDMTRVFVICEEDHTLTQMDSSTRLKIGGPFIPYNISEERIAGAIVVFKTPKTFRVGTSTPYIFVDEVIKAINKDGNLVSGITGISQGAPITVIASGSKVSEAIDLLHKGDIIQVALDSNGEIYDNPPYVSTSDLTIDLDTNSKHGSIKRRFNIENRELKPLDTTSEGSSYGEVCWVYRVHVRQGQIMVTGKDNKKKFVKVNTSTIYQIYDTETKTLSQASLEDLAKGSFIFMKRSENIASDIFIIK